VIGKPLGIVLGCAIAVRAGLASLPRGVGWGGVAVVGAVGGIGFTMSLFVAELAFRPGPALDVARLSIVAASAVAAIAGASLGLALLRRRHDTAATDTAATDTDAERSTVD
jgi:NhaA family Na+:H+ antiporter